jgi:peptidylprolyl isomerase
VRRTPALVSSIATVAMLSAVLAGCAASPDDASACTPLIASGDTSELVKASGEVGSLPTVDIPAPLVVSGSQRSVVEAGTGTVAYEGMTVDYDAVLVDASSGDIVQQTSFDGAAHLTRAGGEGALHEAFVCAQPGTRIAVTTTVGDSGLASSTASEADLARTIVLVLDVTGVYLGKADGVNQLPADGMPVVVTAPDGTVGITIPSGIEIPSGDKTSTIKLGSGEKLAKGDTVVLQAATWTWPADGSGANQKSSTWESDPEAITLNDEGDQALSAPVFDALVGVPVGSQVLIVTAPTGDSVDATVYVFDVLGIRPPADTAK